MFTKGWGQGYFWGAGGAFEMVADSVSSCGTGLAGQTRHHVERGYSKHERHMAKAQRACLGKPSEARCGVAQPGTSGFWEKLVLLWSPPGVKGPKSPVLTGMTHLFSTSEIHTETG